MRLTQLRLTNFRQHVDTTLAFERGLTGIIGPNGAGKSTILEAIAWALYGGDTARGGKESIRFSRAPARSQVRVELEFELGGHRYRVVRGLTMAELYLDGSDAPIANSATTVGEILQRRLGMNRAEFFNTYFTGQKELAVMATLSAAERGQFLSRVLGYEKLRAAQELVDLRRRDLRNEIAGMRSGMSDATVLTQQARDATADLAGATGRLASAELARARAQSDLDAVAPRWAEAQRHRDELAILDAELRLIEIDLGNRRSNAERVATDLARVAEAREALEPLAERLIPIHETGKRLTEVKALQALHLQRQEMERSEQLLATELAELRGMRDLHRGAPDELEATATLLEQRKVELVDLQGRLELARTEWVRDRQEAETRRNALRTQYTEIKEQRERLVNLGDAGTCPTCQRPLGDHLHQVLELLDSQLEAVSADGTYFRGRLDQLETMPPEVAALNARRAELDEEVGSLTKQLGRIQETVKGIERRGREIAAKELRHQELLTQLAQTPGGYDPELHQRLEQEVVTLAELSTQANRLSLQIEREPSLRREHEGILRELQRLEGRQQELLRARAAIPATEELFSAIRDAHMAAESALQTARLDAVRAQGEAVSASASLSRAEAALEELAKVEARLALLEQEKRVHDELIRAYTDLRSELNQQLRPELSELASAFLTELTDARYTEVELDEKYKVSVLEEGIPKPVISGGEEDLANLVLRLAISQMIAERAGQAFSLLVLDEIFGSLDEHRRHHVVELLRGLQDRFEQVILITHIEGVRDGLDQVIEVHFDPNSGAASVRRGADAVAAAGAGE